MLNQFLSMFTFKKCFTICYEKRTEAVKGLQTSDFRLQTSDFRLQTSDFRLQTSDFRLQTSDFRLQTSDFRLQTYAPINVRPAVGEAGQGGGI